MKTVYRAENIIDANLVKDALAQEGIHAFASGEYLAGAIGELPAWDLIRVMVASEDVGRALPVVRAVDRMLGGRGVAADDPCGTLRA